jgi:hypothetical protein
LGSAQLLRASLRLFVGVLAAGVGEGGDRVRSRAAVTVASGAAGTCGWPAAGGADYAPQVSEPAAVVGWPLEPTGASIPPIRPRPGRAHTGEPRTRTLAVVVPGGGEARELWVVGDAPTRCREGAATNTRTLAATSHSNLLPPTAVADAHSYLPNRGLAGIEPEQPNPARRRRVPPV